MGFSIEDIKDANMLAGYHFFDKSTMRSFNSRVSSNVYGVWHGSTSEGNRHMGGQYFVTSERNDMGNYPRLYTVRRYNPEDHSIDTIGEFQQYASLSGALGAAEKWRNYEQETGKWEGMPEPADRNTRVDGGRMP